MPAKLIGQVPGIGIVGAIASSSPGEPYIQAKPVKSTSLPIFFGTGVMVNTDGTYSAVDGTTTAANFGGIAVQEFKQALVYPFPNGAAANVNGSYVAAQQADCLKRGEAFVFCRAGTPTVGGAVFMRIAANGAFPLESLGEFRATADGANTIQLTNANWDKASVDGDLVTVIKIKGVNQ